MAPETQLVPQEGQLLGSVGVVDAATAAADCEGADAALELVGAGTGVGAGVGAGFATAGLATGAVAGTANTFLQVGPGHRTFLPAALSGTCIDILQCGQRMVWGIIQISC